MRINGLLGLVVAIAFGFAAIVLGLGVADFFGVLSPALEFLTGPLTQ